MIDASSKLCVDLRDAVATLQDNDADSGFFYEYSDGKRQCRGCGGVAADSVRVHHALICEVGMLEDAMDSFPEEGGIGDSTP